MWIFLALSRWIYLDKTGQIKLARTFPYIPWGGGVSDEKVPIQFFPVFSRNSDFTTSVVRL